MKRRRLLFVEIFIVGLLFCLYSCSDQTVDQMNYTYEPGVGQIKTKRIIQ